MILAWRQQVPHLSLRWRGPNRLTTAVDNMTQVMEKIAVIAGPPGRQGNDGITQVVHHYEQPTHNIVDGGNF